MGMGVTELVKKYMWEIQSISEAIGTVKNKTGINRQ